MHLLLLWACTGADSGKPGDTSGAVDTAHTGGPADTGETGDSGVDSRDSDTDSGDSGADSGGDSGADSGDSGSDSGADSGSDSADSGSDSGADSGGDSADSGADSGGDSGADSGDSGSDSGADSASDSGADSADTGGDTADTSLTDTADSAPPDTADTSLTDTSPSDTGGGADTTPRDDDGDGWTTVRDCDDTDATISPTGVETCNGRDDDCDGSVDEGVATTYYADDDMDGYGKAGTGVTLCAWPAGYVPDATDCDDADGGVHPGAVETCDHADDDCDGEVDEGVGDPWYTDADGDGYGDATTGEIVCFPDATQVSDATDCDDARDDVHPGADEVCDGADEDCDGVADDDATDAGEWYADADGDGDGDPGAPVYACTLPGGYSDTDTDCDDTDGGVHPGATETCDDVDQDCDGEVDEDAADPGTWYADLDGDGYGDPTDALTACDAPGRVSDATDCDDGDADVHPDAEDACDGLDEDCDGDADGPFSVPEQYASIGDAVDAATEGATVCVAPGSYTEDVVAVTKDLALRGYGGSAATIWSGSGSDRVLTGDGVTLDVEGFTIEGGRTSSNGGCMRFWASDVTLTDLEVTDCIGGSVGGGLYGTTSDVTVYDSTFEANYTEAESTGYAGLGVSEGNLTLVSTVVRDNGNVSEYGSAAAVGLTGDASLYTLSLTNVVVADNWGTASVSWFVLSSGAGVFATAARVDMTNVTIVGNSMEQAEDWNTHGVGFLMLGSFLTMDNVAIIDNVGTGSTSGISLESGVGATITYSDVYGNGWSGDVADPTGTDGNISADPGFTDEAGGDYTLAAGSALIDAGDPAILDGDGSRSDIGAFGGGG